MTVDRCCGQGKLTLPGPIYIGGRADEDDHRFYTGAIAGLQIFTDGATASDFQCIYQGEKSALAGFVRSLADATRPIVQTKKRWCLGRRRTAAPSTAKAIAGSSRLPTRTRSA